MFVLLQVIFIHLLQRCSERGLGHRLWNLSPEQDHLGNSLEMQIPGSEPSHCWFSLVWSQGVLWTSQVVLVVKNSAVNAGDARDKCSIPGSGRSPGGGHGNPLQYSCLEHSMDRGAWWATVHGVTKRWTRLSNSAHIHKGILQPVPTEWWEPMVHLSGLLWACCWTQPWKKLNKRVGWIERVALTYIHCCVQNS